jgi:AcrR family transcriptional regulator
MALLSGVILSTDPVEQLRAFAFAYLDFAAQRPGIYRVLFMTKLREGVPMPEPGAATGQDEGVDTFNDLLALVTACLSEGADPFTQAAELWAGLHGYVALQQVMPLSPGRRRETTSNA